MKKLLWLDDIRDPMEGQWLVFSPITLVDIEVHWVKSYTEFTYWIIENGLPDAICFDHDLGIPTQLQLRDKGFSKRKSRRICKALEKTGYDCAKWLVNYCMIQNKKLPLYNIQSANPIGKENIDKLLKNFIKHNASKN